MTVRFNIINLVKSYSTYQDGMKPCVLSKMATINKQRTWHRAGTNVSYKRALNITDINVDNSNNKPNNCSIDNPSNNINTINIEISANENGK